MESQEGFESCRRFSSTCSETMNSWSWKQAWTSSRLFTQHPVKCTSSYQEAREFQRNKNRRRTKSTSTTANSVMVNINLRINTKLFSKEFLYNFYVFLYFAFSFNFLENYSEVVTGTKVLQYIGN